MLVIINMNIWLLIVMIVDQISGPSYNQPRFCPNSAWHSNALTFTNSSLTGTYPWGLFVTVNNTVYVADKTNNKIQVWLEGNMNLWKTFSGSLKESYAVFVTLDDDIYADNGKNNNRVDMWHSNSTNSIIVMNVADICYGLFVDLYNYIYCSIGNQHQVVKRSLSFGLNSTTIVAGNGTSGSTSFMLSSPRGIFVNNRSDLYVADCGNNRIQLFQFGEFNATTLLGNIIIGTTTLNCPMGIVVDTDGYIFITDFYNNRIVGSGPNGFRCIAGCTGINGSASNQLFYPRGLSFDSYGNIYVADGLNHRIQKFLLATNSCEETTTSDYPSTAVSTLTMETSPITTSHHIVQPTATSFFPKVCPNATYIGPNCSISNTPCAILKPCQNNGTCYNNNTIQHGYVCSCLHGFNGTQCEFNHRPCKSDTCWNDGICNETSNTTFHCLCKPGWEGDHCETKINYCLNIKCENNGVCRPLFMNYTCECLGENYSGRHCEIVASQTIIRQTVSKSFSYIAIVSLIVVLIFIVVMDILKYCFGIDPVHEERERLRRNKKIRQKRKPVIQRFVYIDAPPIPPSSSGKK